MKAPLPRRMLTFAAALAAIHLAGAYLLDALGLVEGLLSPSGGRLVYLIPLAVFFYVVRFLALFVAPGLVLGAIVLWVLDGRAASPRSTAR